VLAPSSLSRACRSVAEFVDAGIGAAAAGIKVTVGTPDAAAKDGADTGHRLNLFFYRLEPAAIGPAPDPGEPWRVRLDCLITAFSTDEDTIGAGEHDLRVLGEVVRLFHERPVLDPVTLNGETLRLHAVFRPLTVDELNHLWSAQGEAVQRPSVAYELAVAPILPRRRTIVAPRVAALGLAAVPVGAPAPRPVPLAPAVRPTRAADADDWVPEACFVADGVAAYALTREVPPADDEVAVWVAGEPGAEVLLRWETWSVAAGWQPGPEHPAQATTAGIDPDAAATAPVTTVPLPFADRAGQAALHAERTWTRPDGAEVVLRGNPLLVTLVRPGP
jgi:hypothetical protein